MAVPRLLGSAGGRTIVWRLLEGVGASGAAAPSGATAGLDMSEVATNVQGGVEDVGAIVISKAAGSSVSIASARAFGFFAERENGAGPNGWGPLGTGSTSGRGLLNGGAAIDEVDSNAILLIEQVFGLWLPDRIGVALGAIGGSDPSVNVDIVFRKRAR